MYEVVQGTPGPVPTSREVFRPRGHFGLFVYLRRFQMPHRRWGFETFGNKILTLGKVTVFAANAAEIAGNMCGLVSRLPQGDITILVSVH